MGSDLVKKGKLRYDLGNPPGKNKSYGDAINWETLLAEVPNNNDLYFISDDKDYFSEINPSKFNSYLSYEWQKEKKSKIIFYKSISNFFSDIFPDIKLATELEKNILLSQLEENINFANSRKVLHKLYGLTNFSTEQANQFVTSCINNNQIYWIGEDSDINKYIYTFVESNIEKIDENLLKELLLKIKKLDISENENLPF